jgi:hypothetical protein
MCPGCVKTGTRRERAELFSLFSSSDGDWQIASFLIQRNRDKLSTRKFDVGVFTQPGSKGEILIPTKCSPPFSQYQTFGGANSATKPLPPTPDFLIVSSGD